MESTWPISNRKFEEHASDLNLHNSGYYDWTHAETLRACISSSPLQELQFGTETDNYTISDKINDKTHPGVVAEEHHKTASFVNITFKTRGLFSYSATSYPLVISRDGGVSWTRIYAGGASGDALLATQPIDVLPGDQVMFVVTTTSQPYNATYVPWKFIYS